ncbi:DUF551 domain-containing protein [Acinetobacter sp. G11]|uniref:DUF551 domain-containing protein n=1 Tax=Acinetobacter sp. G11 TaxID=3415989 RepID=UPI003C7DEBCE
MDIQKKPTLAEKQAFWAEQLPNFEAAYWLPSHFEFVVFDMNQGNYVVKEGLGPDFEDDVTEIYHRVNTSWTMWKKAINFSRKKAQAVPEWILVEDQMPPVDETVLVCWDYAPDIEPDKEYTTIDENLDEYWPNCQDEPPTHWMPLPKVIKAQEQSHE